MVRSHAMRDRLAAVLHELGVARHAVMITERIHEEYRQSADGNVSTKSTDEMTVSLQIDDGLRQGSIEFGELDTSQLKPMLRTFLASLRSCAPTRSTQFPRLKGVDGDTFTARPSSAWAVSTIDHLARACPVLLDASGSSELKLTSHRDVHGNVCSHGGTRHVIRVGVAALAARRQHPILRFQAETATGEGIAPDDVGFLSTIADMRPLSLDNSDLPETDHFWVRPWAMRSYLEVLLVCLTGDGATARRGVPGPKLLFDLEERPHDRGQVGACPLDDYGRIRVGGPILRDGELSAALTMRAARNAPVPGSSLANVVLIPNEQGQSVDRAREEGLRVEVLNGRVNGLDRERGTFSMVCTGRVISPLGEPTAMIQFSHQDEIFAFLGTALAIGTDVDSQHNISTPSIVFPNFFR